MADLRVREKAYEEWWENYMPPNTTPAQRQSLRIWTRAAFLAAGSPAPATLPPCPHFQAHKQCELPQMFVCGDKPCLLCGEEK